MVEFPTVKDRPKHFRPIMAPVTHHSVHVNRIKIHYVESGEGPPLVLLHGFPETWYCWRHQIPVLADKFRVIVPDLRGYGGTEKPLSGYDKRTMANDIRALLQHLEIEKVSMIGHDRGARVATRFAKDHPAMLDRLVVMDNIPTRIISAHECGGGARTLVLYFQQCP